MPVIDVRPEVAAFAIEMERVLAENDHRGPWPPRSEDAYAFAEKARERSYSLGEVTKYGGQAAVLVLSVDVACYALLTAAASRSIPPFCERCQNTRQVILCVNERSDCGDDGHECEDGPVQCSSCKGASA